MASKCSYLDVSEFSLARSFASEIINVIQIVSYSADGFRKLDATLLWPIFTSYLDQRTLLLVVV